MSTNTGGKYFCLGHWLRTWRPWRISDECWRITDQSPYAFLTEHFSLSSFYSLVLCYTITKLKLFKVLNFVVQYQCICFVCFIQKCFKWFSRHFSDNYCKNNLNYWNMQIPKTWHRHFNRLDQQADIKMLSHGLRRPVEHKLVRTDASW